MFTVFHAFIAFIVFMTFIAFAPFMMQSEAKQSKAKESGAMSSEVMLDLSALPFESSVFAVRYAWGRVNNSERYFCCNVDTDPLMGISKPCLSTGCALRSTGGLPVNPFIAKVVDGRCQCLEPQTCDG